MGSALDGKTQTLDIESVKGQSTISSKFFTNNPNSPDNLGGRGDDSAIPSMSIPIPPSSSSSSSSSSNPNNPSNPNKSVLSSLSGQKRRLENNSSNPSHSGGDWWNPKKQFKKTKVQR